MADILFLALAVVSAVIVAGIIVILIWKEMDGK